MPYVKRGEQGEILAVSHEPVEGITEKVELSDPLVNDFLAKVNPGASPLSETDQSFVRVLEDVVQLLIDKGVILFTELPVFAQEKISLRQRLRKEQNRALNLIDDD